MPSTPTTKSQVQAYRFVLRRMQSALVRKDAVMLHDPMRTHSRATVVGVCLAGIGLIGFLIWGILSPQAKAPGTDGIVIGKPSGQVYVLIAKPDRKLIPVFNLASARLLLMAQQQEGSQDQQGAGGAAPAPGAVKVVAPSVVDDNQLRDIPKGRKVGIADGPDLLPSADQRIDSVWTVCDQYLLNKDLNDPASENKVETTVIAGVKGLGKILPQDQSLLVKAPDGAAYLVYRTPGTANLPNTSAVRAKVDLTNSAVLAALNLKDKTPRVITTGMLNAIPEKAELRSPDIPGRGTDSNIDLGDRDLRKVGSVFRVERAGGVTNYYVLLKDGIQLVKRSTADLIRYFDNPGAPEYKAVNPDKVPDLKTPKVIDDSTYPAGATEVLNPDSNPVACLGWSYTGSGGNAEERTAVYIGDTLPGISTDSKGVPSYVDISTPNADGVRIDHFFMPPGRGAVVRQATSREDFAIGQLTLVSDRGVKYGIPDKATADGLGLDNAVPAPRDIIQLLPDGASLSVKDVKQSYDSTPFAGGVYPSTTKNSGGG
jgi:ESX secretion system ATPase EccB